MFASRRRWPIRAAIAGSDGIRRRAHHLPCLPSEPTRFRIRMYPTYRISLMDLRPAWVSSRARPYALQFGSSAPVLTHPILNLYTVVLRRDDSIGNVLCGPRTAAHSTHVRGQD